MLLCGLMVSSSATLFSQSSSAGRSAEPEGVTSGGYLIHSSGELGYRSSDVTGSGDMYVGMPGTIHIRPFEI
jgi:hypothetical protein